jgi:CheY-like chemotaxis protein
MKCGKILVIDDDSEDMVIIREAMEMISADNVMLFAEDGEQALQLLDTRFVSDHNVPCLIVLDLNMPKMNGTQTLETLKADNRFRDIPVIIYSTSINPFEQAKCVNLGAHSYITKPVSLKESLETAQVFLDFCRTA